MRILICHGYLLKGTGSNQYVQSMARAMCRQGHHLAIMCQDADPRLDFVSAYLEERPDSPETGVAWERDTGYPGSCIVYKPYIGGLLPVYVMDEYTGFEVKEFGDLTDRELAAYVEMNRASLERLIGRFAPEAIQVNHAVMLPYIVKPLAGERSIPYFVSIHGSAIDFTVRRQERYLQYGAQGLDGSTGIVVPSAYTAGQVKEVFTGLLGDLDEKLLFIPPGVDTGLFGSVAENLEASVEAVIAEVERRTAGAGSSDWLPEPDMAMRLRELASADSPSIVFLGKLLETKGVQCALPALPLILSKVPGARLIVIGFGELKGMLEKMLGALDRGDLEALRRACEYGNRSYTRVEGSFTPVLDFLDALARDGHLEEYRKACLENDFNRAVVFTGYLAPEEHRHLLPHARALLVPSLAPEAFGLVAVEAMASGVVPVATPYTGLATALEPLRAAWGDGADRFVLGDRGKMVGDIADACVTALEMPEGEYRARCGRMCEEAGRMFSWEAVARDMVDAFERALR